MNLASWLRSLGLEQYEAAFRENAIDNAVLPNLTAEDLKDLGVGLVGHRRKLLDAIAALRTDASAEATSADDLPAIDKPPSDVAERRQVTVMFSDLVGSTALSVAMDPEDLRDALRSTGTTMWSPLYLSGLAKIYGELGRIDDARGCIREAITGMETSKEIVFAAEVHRVAGEIALRAPQPNRIQAHAYFRRALTIAREQRAKSWELRAATSLARLLRDEGKRCEARALLAPVYDWFTQGFDTLDLKEARSLLDALAS